MKEARSCARGVGDGLCCGLTAAWWHSGIVGRECPVLASRQPCQLSMRATMCACLEPPVCAAMFTPEGRRLCVHVDSCLVAPSGCWQRQACAHPDCTPANCPCVPRCVRVERWVGSPPAPFVRRLHVFTLRLTPSHFSNLLLPVSAPPPPKHNPHSLTRSLTRIQCMPVSPTPYN